MPPETRMQAVLATLPSDAHGWNLVALELLLREEGFTVANLGVCTPAEEVLEACRRLDPRVLVVSTLNGHGGLEGPDLIRRVRAQRRFRTLPCVIGGHLGVDPARHENLAAQLREAGFDAVYRAEQVEDFRGFLGAIRSRAEGGATAGEGYPAPPGPKPAREILLGVGAFQAE